MRNFASLMGLSSKDKLNFGTSPETTKTMMNDKDRESWDLGKKDKQLGKNGEGGGKEEEGVPKF